MAATVYVCGSFRFEHVMDDVCRFLAQQPDTVCLRSPSDDPRGILGCLDRVGRSELVYVVNPGGYVGKSVAVDIGFAHGRGIRLAAMEAVCDPPVAEFVTAPVPVEDLPALLAGEQKASQTPGRAGDLDATALLDLLDSLKNPVLFADVDHTIRYLNRAAASQYRDAMPLVGACLLDCHNEASRRLMGEIVARMQQGLEEQRITDNEKHRIYMRAVRSESGRLIGYYERYEPPR